MDDVGRRPAIERRTDDGIANDPASLARAHHALVVLGGPRLAILEQLAFVETPGVRHGDLVVIVLRPLERVTLAHQLRFSARERQAATRNVQVRDPALKLSTWRARADGRGLRDLQISHAGVQARQRQFIQIAHAVLHLIASELLEQANVGHVGRVAITSGRLLHQHNRRPRQSGLDSVLIDAQARYVDEFQDGQTVWIVSRSRTSWMIRGDVDIVVEVAFVIDVDPTECRALVPSRVSNWIQEHRAAVGGQMRFAGQSRHYPPPDLRRWPFLRCNVHEQLPVVEELEVLASQAVNRPVDPLGVFGHIFRHVFNDSRLLVCFRVAGWLNSGPRDSRVDAAQSDSVMDGTGAADVHPGHAESERRAGVARLVGEQRVASSDEGVEQVAGDPRSDGASETHVRLALGVNAEYHETSEQKAHFMRLEHRAHLNDVHL